MDHGNQCAGCNLKIIVIVIDRSATETLSKTGPLPLLSMSFLKASGEANLSLQWNDSRPLGEEKKATSLFPLLLIEKHNGVIDSKF